MSAVIEVDSAEVVSVAVLVEADLPSGMMRVWTGTDPLRTLDGRLWQPIADFGAVSELERGTALEAPQFAVELALHDVDEDDAARFRASVAEALGEDTEGRAISVWLQWFDAETGALLGEPEAEIVGRMARPQASLVGVGEARLRVGGEHEAAYILRGTDGWLTPADQEARHPGDRGCDVTGRLEGRDVVWPRV